MAENRATRVDSFAARLDREKEKAIQKYGEMGQHLGGHPDYDILDYAINEVVGMHRYAEMIQARADDADEDWPSEVRANLRNLSAQMRRFATNVGEDLIKQRNILVSNNIYLGKPETR